MYDDVTGRRQTSVPQGRDELADSSPMSQETEHNERWAALKAKFLAALQSTSGGASRRYLQLWKVFVEDAWYQDRLHACATHVVGRKRNAAQWQDDVIHEAMLLLARNLRRSPDLRVSRARSFGDWMNKIILRDCREALRRLRRLSATPELHRVDEAVDERDIHDARIDVRLAVDQLGGREKTAVRLYAQGVAMTVIAREMKLSPRQSRYAVRRGLKQLRLLVDTDYEE